MRASIILGAVGLIGLFPSASFGQQQPVPTVVEIPATPILPEGLSCSIDKCPDYAERYPTCDCDLKENLIRHAIFPNYLIPARPMRIDYIFRRW